MRQDKITFFLKQNCRCILICIAVQICSICGNHRWPERCSARLVPKGPRTVAIPSLQALQALGPWAFQGGAWEVLLHMKMLLIIYNYTVYIYIIIYRYISYHFCRSYIYIYIYMIYIHMIHMLYLISISFHIYVPNMSLQQRCCLK